MRGLRGGNDGELIQWPIATPVHLPAVFAADDDDGILGDPGAVPLIKVNFRFENSGARRWIKYIRL